MKPHPEYSVENQVGDSQKDTECLCYNFSSLFPKGGFNSRKKKKDKTKKNTKNIKQHNQRNGEGEIEKKLGSMTFRSHSSYNP